jgi:hypothetical protein
MAHEEVPRGAKDFRVLIFHRTDAVLPALIDDAVRIREEDGRVGGDDELAVLQHEVMDSYEGGHLPLGREGGLGLIEKIESIPAHAAGEEREKGLAMGALMRGLASPVGERSVEGIAGLVFLHLGHKSVEALGAEVEVIVLAPGTPGEAQMFMQAGVGIP